MAQAPLTTFAPQDEFLRRVRLRDHVKKGLVHWRAFKDNDIRMSWTYRDETLKSDQGIDAYHEYFSELVGEPLPAILTFSCLGLGSIQPPLLPMHDPDPEDRKYGHLHCSTDSPRDKPHREMLAKLVNDGVHARILRLYS